MPRPRPTEKPLRVAALTLAFIMCSCSSDKAAGPVNARSIPPALRLLAEASGVDPTRGEITCSIDALLNLEGPVERRGDEAVYHGTGGGDARRTIVPTSGNTIAFWAEFFIANLEIHLVGADSIEVRDVTVYNDPEPSRFWTELTRFRGNTRTLVPGELAQGTWLCQPMDTPPSSGEYYDPSGVAAGTWKIAAR